MTPTPKYKPHPLAKIFPAMDADDKRKLTDDIRQHGLQEPITLFAGMVLDGVHRQEACSLAGVEPRYVRFEELNGSTQEAGPLAFVMSRNLRRRHLNASQKAAVAADSLFFLRRKRQSGKRQRSSGKTVTAKRR